LYASYAEPPAAGPSRARTAGIAGLLALAIVALGAPLGWLWSVVSPRLEVIKVEQGFLYAQAEPEQPIAADGWFAIIGAAAGVTLALLAWWLLRRHRGAVVMGALLVGSLGAAVLAWWVGHEIGYAQFTSASAAASVGDHLNAPIGLAISHLGPHRGWRLFPTGVGAVQALLAVFTYGSLAGFSSWPDLRSAPEPIRFGLEPSADAADQFGPGLTGGTDQFGPGLTGSSDNAMGTART
jgi:hypothetical protein